MKFLHLTNKKQNLIHSLVKKMSCGGFDLFFYLWLYIYELIKFIKHIMFQLMTCHLAEATKK